jgi:hypothetical protein
LGCFGAFSSSAWASSPQKRPARAHHDRKKRLKNRENGGRTKFDRSTKTAARPNHDVRAHKTCTWSRGSARSTSTWLTALRCARNPPRLHSAYTSRSWTSGAMPQTKRARPAAASEMDQSGVLTACTFVDSAAIVAPEGIRCIAPPVSGRLRRPFRMPDQTDRRACTGFGQGHTGTHGGHW